MRFLLIIATLVYFGVLSSATQTTKSEEEQFNDFVIRFNKVYNTKEERAYRLSIFKNNLKRISSLNNKHSTTDPVYGVGPFSDLSREEFAAKKLRPINQKKSGSFVTRSHAAPPPSTPIDWRAQGKTSPIKNQGQCGSAFAVAVVETVESANAVVGKNLTYGSVQEVEDCVSPDSGCNGGGDPDTIFDWVIQQGGLETEECYGPYTGQCNMKNCAVNPDPNLELTAVVPVSQSDEALYGALSKSPVFVCVDAETWQDYTGGIVQASECGTNVDHCVQLVGYAPQQGGYWILKNSWGTNWGMNGYIWLQYGQNTCAITDVAIIGVA